MEATETISPSVSLRSVTSFKVKMKWQFRWDVILRRGVSEMETKGMISHGDEYEEEEKYKHYQPLKECTYNQFQARWH